jgi:hypothetical protein
MLLALAGGLVSAQSAGSVTDLGKPTNDRSGNPNFPLDGFHKVKTNLTANHRPELLFISTQHDPRSAAERWPLVKALDRFGVLSHVDTAVTTVAPILSARDNPTFDLTHATYRSRYLTFVHKDVIDGHGHYLQKLTSTEHGLYVKYVQFKGPANLCNPNPADPERFLCSVDRGFQTTRMFPLLLIGGYLQTTGQFILPSMVADQTGQNGLTFATIQTALRSDKEPFSGSTLVSAVNGEANIITALICRVDGKKPGSVCGRSVIKQLLRHVR